MRTFERLRKFARVASAAALVASTGVACSPSAIDSVGPETEPDEDAPPLTPARDAAVADERATPGLARADAPGETHAPDGAGPEPSDVAVATGDASTDVAVGNDAPARPAQILPVIWLQVPGQTFDNVPRDKVAGQIKIIEDHDGTHASGKLQSAPTALTASMGISLHGRSSSGFPQKSFSIELRKDGTQEERKLPVLGMPAESDWMLIACWTDKPCMRNALAYSIGQAIGQTVDRWNSPRFRFVEVYFNGVYEGLYQLVEPIRQGKYRVAMPEPAPDKATGDVTGGYIFSRESGGKGSPSSVPLRDWMSPAKDPDGFHTVYTFRYPKDTKITPAQKTYIRDHMAAFETVMYGPGWNDPVKGYRPWIDWTSWLDFILITELSHELDKFLLSAYLTKLPDVGGVRGKLLFSPWWDFNIGFGNANYMDGWKPDVWHYKTEFAAAPEYSAWPTSSNCSPTGCTSAWTPYFFRRVWADPAFKNDLACRWKELRRPGGAIESSLVFQWIDSWKKALGPLAVPRHFKRWPDLQKPVWPNPCQIDGATGELRTGATNGFKVSGLPDPNCGSPKASPAAFFDYEVSWLRAWVDRRLKWLDANLTGTCP